MKLGDGTRSQGSLRLKRGDPRTRLLEYQVFLLLFQLFIKFMSFNLKLEPRDSGVCLIMCIADQGKGA